MKILTFNDFMKKKSLKNDTMNESDLQKVNNYSIYPRDSKMFSDKRFVNIDNGFQGGTHWTCFIVKDNKSFYSLTQLEELVINFHSIRYLNR